MIRVMARRYRMTPNAGRETAVMLEHCAHAAFVWNLACELSQWGTLETYGEAERRARDDGTTYVHQKHRPVRPRPKLAGQCRMLTEAREEFDWLRAGSSSVQAQALRDFDHAMSAFLDPKNPAKRPGFRSRRGTQGFVIRDAKARRVSRNVGEVYVPKAGWVRFRWSRDLPAKLGMARVTLDRAGRWHVSFPAGQPPVDRKPTGAAVGIDRGVRTALVTSDGQHYRAPRISDRAAGRYLALQRRHARQAKGSKRREKTRQAMARITAKVTDRRKDWAEKISTRLVRDHDLIVFEKLNIQAMSAAPKPRPDPGQPGGFLPNRARAKAGLNKGILASAWGTLAARTGQKAEASGCAVLYVDPRFTSQQCHACGHTAKGNRESQAVFLCEQCGHSDHADANAARNVLARGLAAQAAVSAPAHGHGAKRPRKTAKAAAGTTRDAA
jgi:putative transposase